MGDAAAVFPRAPYAPAAGGSAVPAWGFPRAAAPLCAAMLSAVLPAFFRPATARRGTVPPAAPPAVPVRAVPLPRQGRFAQTGCPLARAAQDLQMGRRFAPFAYAPPCAPFLYHNQKSGVFPPGGAAHAAPRHRAGKPDAPVLGGAAAPVWDKRAFLAAFCLPRPPLPSFMYFQRFCRPVNAGRKAAF